MTVVAVAGAGFIGPVHVEGLQRQGATVRGITGVTPEEAQEAARKLGLEVAYASFDELIADPLVEAVHIATPNHLHFEMAKKALEAGKHVVCEKPLAMTTTETAELVRIAREHPELVGAVNYNLRYYPLALQARELVQSGEIGEVYHVRGAYVQDWLLFDTDWNWRLLPGAGGELRAVGDIGTHWMDLIASITGLKVTSLLADLGTFVKVRRKPLQAVATFEGKKSEKQPVETEPVEIDTEDYGAVLFNFEGGAKATMNVSQVMAGRKNQLSFEIAGSKASLAWDSERPNELWIGRRNGPNELLMKDPSLLDGVALGHADYPGGHNEGFPDTFKQLYRSIYSYIEAGDFSQPKPFPTWEDGHHEVVLCEAILKSHQERRWVDLTE